MSDEWQEIVRQRPVDLDEAIPCMRKALDHYHARNDHRAVFLRAYYIISLEVHAAVHQLGEYRTQIFFDPQWIKRLAGKFSTLYFESLSTADRGGERAWKIAHRLAETKRASVVQDLILGLNAHINYDLANGIFMNLEEHGDDKDHLMLPYRKFDHDQVNNILVRCMPKIQETLTRDYGGVLLLLSRVCGQWDEKLTEAGLRYYRERVWWNAVSYLAAKSGREIQLVDDKLDWESAQVAEAVTRRALPFRALSWVCRLLRKRRFGHIELEGLGGIRGSGPLPGCPAGSPFGAATA